MRYFNCELCQKPARAPNLILAKSIPFHIGCLVENYRKVKTTQDTLVEALEKARAALYNVPEVGHRYDQQHSHTHTQACLDIEGVLARTKFSTCASYCNKPFGHSGKHGKKE